MESVVVETATRLWCRCAVCTGHTYSGAAAAAADLLPGQIRFGRKLPTTRRAGEPQGRRWRILRAESFLGPRNRGGRTASVTSDLLPDLRPRDVRCFTARLTCECEDPSARGLQGEERGGSARCRGRPDRTERLIYRIRPCQNRQAVRCELPKKACSSTELRRNRAACPPRPAVVNEPSRPRLDSHDQTLSIVWVAARAQRRQILDAGLECPVKMMTTRTTASSVRGGFPRLGGRGGRSRR